MVVAGLRPFAADLVEHLVRAEIEGAIVVRVPAGAPLPLSDPGVAVLVVTASTAQSDPSLAHSTRVSVVSLDPVSGLASSHVLASGDSIPLGELTPELLRRLAEGEP